MLRPHHLTLASTIVSRYCTTKLDLYTCRLQFISVGVYQTAGNSTRGPKQHNNVVQIFYVVIIPLQALSGMCGLFSAVCNASVLKSLVDDIVSSSGHVIAHGRNGLTVRLSLRLGLSLEIPCLLPGIRLIVSTMSCTMACTHNILSLRLLETIP